MEGIMQYDLPKVPPGPGVAVIDPEPLIDVFDRLTYRAAEAKVDGRDPSIHEGWKACAKDVKRAILDIGPKDVSRKGQVPDPAFKRALDKLEQDVERAAVEMAYPAPSDIRSPSEIYGPTRNAKAWVLHLAGYGE